MRRLVLALTATALLGAGLFVPAQARTASSAADALTGGTVKIVTGFDPTTLLGTWTTTLSGQVAAGGRVYSGTASGTEYQDNPYGYPLSFAGNSASGSISGYCFSENPPDLRRVLGYGAPWPPVSPPAGVFVASCSVSIDGAPNAGVSLVLALVPTADPNTYTGVFAAAPDGVRVDNLPTVPLVSFGSSTAYESYDSFGSTFSVTYTGQITLGAETFHGTAVGTSSSSNGGPAGIPPFTLSGTSPTGSVNATCSAEFTRTGAVETDYLGVGLSVVSCDGSANGGAPGHATLVSVYRVNGHEVHAGERTSYEGAFIGI